MFQNEHIFCSLINNSSKNHAGKKMLEYKTNFHSGRMDVKDDAVVRDGETDCFNPREESI